MPGIFATVSFTPHPAKFERVKILAQTLASDVEENQPAVLQFQLFEEAGSNGEDTKDGRKIVVHMKVSDEEGLDQFHGSSAFQSFWGALPAEDLLVIPPGMNRQNELGGFVRR